MHERGRAREVHYSPSRQGGGGGGGGDLPRKTFEFWALLCAFLMGFLCVWDQISVRVFTGSDLITGSDRIGPEIDYLAHFLTFFLLLLLCL